MKKGLIYVVLICTMLLSGCGMNSLEGGEEEPEKKCKIEVLSAKNDELLQTVEAQETVNKLLDSYNWKSVGNLPEDLIPEYKLVVYQEKTILLGQDPNAKRDYEIIETLFTYQDSPYVMEVISGDVIKSMKLSEEYLTTYYTMPDDAIETLQSIVN